MRRPRRWARRLGFVVAVAVVAIVGAGAAWMWSLPGVAGAETTTAARLADHRSTSVGAPPPAKLARSVVDTEDEHFYGNFVLNTAGGAARAFAHLVVGGADPGGSTIDQQLAKLLYVKETGIAAEFDEVGLAAKLDLTFSRAQVLQMYLDVAYFGHGYYGAEAAAEGYFGRSAANLDWAQAALLAGLLQAPSAYDPLVHYSLAKDRQLHVLGQLVANRALTPTQAAAAYREPLGLQR